MQYSIVDSPLGKMLMAQNNDRLCALLLGDETQQLVCDLQRRFPQNLLVEDDHALHSMAEKIAALLETPALNMDIPLVLEDTPFQQQVWQALRAIPIGQTVSYSDIAHRLGKPKAMRAVAQACGANPIAIVVPCHRVVRRDGQLSGYRWGVARKRWLLERERTGKPC